MLSGWMVAAIFAGRAGADCFTIEQSPPQYSTRITCTNGTNAVEIEEFQGAIFIPIAGPCDSCALTNATITPTHCIVLNYFIGPDSVPGGGGLAFFQVTIQPLPGFTNAQVVINTPCYSFTNFFTFPDPTLPTVPVFGAVSVNQNLYVGDEADFAVDVCSALSVSCQWQKDGVPLTNNAHISGADTALLTIHNTQMTDMGDYILTASNSVGPTNWDTGYLTVSDPTATFDPPEMTTNGFQLSLSSVADLTYVVQTATNLTGTNWSPICTNVAPFIYLDDPSNNASRRFYRAVYVPAL